LSTATKYSLFPSGSTTDLIMALRKLLFLSFGSVQRFDAIPLSIDEQEQRSVCHVVSQRRGDDARQSVETLPEIDRLAIKID
jgi:hypothetical protein